MSTRAIEQLGTFWAMDSEGYVVNDASIDKITPPWSAIIDRAVQMYTSNLGNRLMSIYVRGSVSRGRGIPGWSDVDTFAIVHHDGGELFEWKDAPWTQELEQEMRRTNDCFSKIESMLVTYTDDLLRSRRGLAMVIKTQSACLYGEDLAARIDRFRPGREMILDLRWLRADIEGYVQKIQAAPDDQAVRKACSSLMKVLLRNGFELVMERAGKYTTDLYLCYRTFAEYYPHKEADMRRTLELYLNPVVDRELLVGWIRVFGKWMLQESSGLEIEHRSIENGLGTV